jgi:hypothetical protein
VCLIEVWFLGSNAVSKAKSLDVRSHGISIDVKLRGQHSKCLTSILNEVTSEDLQRMVIELVRSMSWFFSCQAS